MSFFDNPEVDLYSEASEESVNTTRRFFCQRKGFLAREENPDKGVDLDVELLLDGEISGFKFAIQIKSTQHIDMIKEGDNRYLRYPIKTSRLGYLCRRKPGLGIVLVYDDENKTLYYEYVEKIYARIMDDKGDDSWENNETVTMYIDEKNVVNDVSIEGIYKTMKIRHLNFSSMYAEKAYDFDLPTFDRNEFRDPISALEKYGYVFFNKNEYHILHSIISSLPTYKILANHKVLLLAAITHYEIGYYMEGDFYAGKCSLVIDEYSEEEKELLSMAQLSSEFFFGKIDRNAYLTELRRSKASMKSKMNLILVRLKILFFDAFSCFKEGEVSREYIADEINSIWTDTVESGMQEDVRQYFLLEILSCIQQIGILAFIDTMARLRIYRLILGEMPLSDRISIVEGLSFFISRPMQLLESISDYATKTNDDYLKAMVIFKKNYMFYSFSLHNTFFALSQGKDIDEIKKTSSYELFALAYEELIVAYNIFAERMNLSNAYRILTLSLEVNYLCSILFQKNIDQNRFEKITAIVKDLEAKLNKREYEILTESMLKNLVIGRNCDPLLALPLDDVRPFAKMIVESLGIPQDRMDNIVFDIVFLQEASKAVNQQYFEVLQNLKHTKQIATLYKEKPKYVIRCKKCSYETSESNDLKVLLQDLRIEHGYICL
jgi:hypothetical protein